MPAHLLEYTGTPDEARGRIVRGWMEHSGPMTAADLARETGIPVGEVDFALVGLESTGLVLRGRYTPARNAEEEWCERTLLARIHRLTLGRLRREIEPVHRLRLPALPLRWQHVHPGSSSWRARSERGRLRQLQGFQLASGGWERACCPRGCAATTRPAR